MSQDRYTVSPLVKCDADVAGPTDNITPGSETISGNTVVFGDHSSPTESSGSITYIISGKSLGGDLFTRTINQPFSVTTQGADGAPGDTGATGPNFSFLTGSLAEVDTSTAIPAGLLMNDDVFGFQNGISQGATAALTDFTSFLDSNGSFYLGGNANGISESGDFGYFAWNNSDRSLLISGSAVDIKVDKFYLGKTGQFISGSGGNIEISSSQFHLQPDGDVITNNITGSGILINGNARIEGAVTASDLRIEGNAQIADTVQIGGIPEILFFEDFSSSTTVADYTGSDNRNTDGSDKTFFKYQDDGEMSIIQNQTDTVEGTNALQIGDNSGNDMIWASNNFLIPYDGVSLYEYEIRIKQTLPLPHTGSNTGQDPYGFYAGYTGYEADGSTLTNVSSTASFSSQHYTAASNQPLKVNYQTFKGYLKGNSVGPSNENGAGNANASRKRFKSQPGTAQVDVAFVAPMFLVNYQNDLGTTIIDYIKVTRYKQGGLRVGAGGITTGLLQSFNLNADSGSQIDMDNGTMNLGGTSIDRGFQVDESGMVLATNLSERIITINSSNKALYYENYSSKTRLIFDGSLGGAVCMNMKLDVAPDNPIGDIQLPNGSAADARSHVKIIVAADGVQFEDGAGGLFAGVHNTVGQVAPEAR